MDRKSIAIIGGGPAGLMAAEMAAQGPHTVTVFDAMPTVGRKLLMAGKSGLNITHAEEFERFAARFGAANSRLGPALEAFAPSDIRAWAAALGSETFVGSSGKVFPTSMKASPLLRAWLARLDALGVTISTRHRWMGFAEDALVFETPQGQLRKRFDAVVLALGGASWPRLGSDAAWVLWLEGKGIQVNPFRPANCGFEVAWSDVFAQRFAGHPVKAVAARSDGGTVQGEFVVTRTGIEGSLVYAHAAALRDALEREGRSALALDLVPGRSVERIAKDLARVGAKESLANRLRKAAGLDGIKAALVREFSTETERGDLAALARRIKDVQVPVVRPRPIAEAISAAGGVAWDEVDDSLMLRRLPGVFVAGEMLDWEAPTGGYLLSACLATGRLAGLSAAA